MTQRQDPQKANEQSGSVGSKAESSDKPREGQEAARQTGSGVTSGQSPRPHAPSLRHATPFSLMRRFTEDVDRMFAGFLNPLSPKVPSFSTSDVTSWPKLEVSQSGNKLIVQADLPGMKLDDIQVEVRDSELCISGERREESKQEEQGYVRTERSYGSFCRTVPLPEDAQGETASASFEDGVLRVEIETKSSAQKGRRIQVRPGSART